MPSDADIPRGLPPHSENGVDNHFGENKADAQPDEDQAQRCQPQAVASTAIDIAGSLRNLTDALATVEQKLAERVELNAERHDGDVEVRKQLEIARRCTDDAGLRLSSALKDLRGILDTVKAVATPAANVPENGASTQSEPYPEGETHAEGGPAHSENGTAVTTESS